MTSATVGKNGMLQARLTPSLADQFAGVLTCLGSIHGFLLPYLAAYNGCDLTLTKRLHVSFHLGMGSQLFIWRRMSACTAYS